ncbi:calcium:proton antiporter [Streptacidiphilus sp. P02-A3a]|uniref:calcium:proton antiporter n=1 Tax=Streptacidiphilus sp. P02-A3a TaxID=2704468 RepID=UPI0015FBAFA5|nr:ionic transporter y4hA [Streptacidiphilus sp. P02-A3a]QMU68855.1 ionic transporter y4hA [Streptacidiphilus sp. P02-A3a]
MSDTPRPWWQSWTVLAPPIALVVLLLTFGHHIAVWLAVLLAVVLGFAVLAAVHHAEVVAERVGEPFGSLVLAIAVTVIEVALIVTLMISGESGAASLARDTVFAAVMITTNGIVGLSLLTGAQRFGVAVFNPEGTGAALATVATLSALSLVLPTFTSTPGPEFSPAQLSFAALASIALYAMFVSTQTGRHRGNFLPVPTGGTGVPTTATVPPAESGSTPTRREEGHSSSPSARAALFSLGLLLVALVDVVGLAKVESHSIESAVKAAGAPPSFVGVVIALLVLAPETLAAVRAARREQVQISLNLGYGSAMASIGLTIPSIAVATIWLKGPLELGLGSTQLVLLTLTVAVSILTVVPGRATRLQGGIHLVLLAAFVFLAIKP